MSQPRHVLHALADIPTTFDYLTFKRPFHTTVMVKYKNKKNINKFSNALKMSRQLPFPRGPPPSGPGQRQEQRRPMAPNLHGESMYPQQFAPRSDNELATRSEQRPSFYHFKGSQDSDRRPKYGRRSLSPRLDQYRQSYSDPFRDHHQRFESGSDNRDRSERSSYQKNHDSNTDYCQGQRKPNNKYPTAPRRFERERKSSKNASNRPSRGNGSFRRVASEREFLRTNRAPTPQLMLGMNLEADSAAKFLPIEDLSDSEEADMDLSGDEQNDPEKQEPRTIASSNGNSTRLCLNPDPCTLITQGDLIENNSLCTGKASSPSKSTEKRVLLQETAEKECNSTPRWSNPDPYTALPPPDESQKKKKDVVKLIRKARIASEKKKDSEATTDDFISLNIEEISVLSPTAPLDKNVPNKGRGKSISDAENRPRSERVQDSKPNSKNIRSPSPQNTMAGNSKQSEKKENKSKSTKKASAPDLTSDPNLGSRKRTARDEIKQPPLIYEKGVRPPPDGRILKIWLPHDGLSQTPWLIDHSNAKSMHHRLHEEILDFYQFVKPQWYEQSIRENLIYDLRRRVRNFYTGVDIISFGSFPAGLYLPTADLDLVMISDSYVHGGRPQYGYSPKQVRRFARFLEQERIVLRGSQECILKAKVPLVKYVDNLTGLRVDISFENTTGLVANKTFQNWKNAFPAMPILVTLIKQFLSMRGLNEPVNGGIGGFSVTCLVVSLLQHMPQVQERAIVPEQDLGKVLMEFFDLYGNKFNTMETAISLNPARYVSKSELDQTYRKKVDKFSIIDPNNPKNDIAGGSRNSVAIKRAFKNAHGNLQKRMDELENTSSISNQQPQSILSCILGGNYSTFKLQREHLAHIYESKIGPLKLN